MNFGLMFFASSEDALTGDKYRVVRESARFADANGLESVWVPERHFTEFGSLYPNPAVLHSALAMVTERVRLMAGSVVAPLHNPIRIAEEWSMVDNLSNGRVGISFAPGWNPSDFALRPEKYEGRREEMLAAIGRVRDLWRGGSAEAIGGTGERVTLRIYPTPVQPELPVWLTAAGSPGTFGLAGEMGVNVLTHLLDQDEEQLASKINLYRQARVRNGYDPAAGIVTVMLHTFVGSDAKLVREQARAPFCQYIRTNAGLLNGLARSRGQRVDIANLPSRELEEFVQFLYERFAASRGLIGTPESCLDLVRRLAAMGVNEIACLLDFGPPPDAILENLPHLLRLKKLCAPKRARVAAVRFDPAEVQSRCTEQIGGEKFNERMRAYGVQAEGAFQSIVRVWRRDGEALGEIRMAESAGGYHVHPAFLDAGGRVLAAAIGEQCCGGSYYLPAGVGSLRVHGRAETDAWSHATVRKSDDREAIVGDVRIYGGTGRLLIEIDGLKLQRVRSRNRDLEGLFYRRRWKVAPGGGPEGLTSQQSSLPGEWLIVPDNQGVAERFARMLEETGSSCRLLWEDCDLAERPWRGIVHLASLDLSPGDVEARKRVAGSVLRIVQAKIPGRLWLVTAGAVPVLDGEFPAIAQAPVWGLAGAIAVEHPERWGGAIDLDGNAPAAEDLLDAAFANDGEHMVAYRGGKRYVPRLVREDPAKTSPVRFEHNATHLITGGLGGLGLKLASWLVEKGARHLAIVGRSAPSEAASEVLRRIEASGAKVMLLRADVRVREEVAATIAELSGSMPRLKGVFHLAGALDDALLTEETPEHFERACAAKIEGAWNLHKILGETPLDHFVLFSSMASLVTAPGQANYAAANAFLDALAHLRRAQGKPALSVNWGPWAETGHAATSYGGAAHARLAQLGIAALPPETGLAALDALLARQTCHAAVAKVDWALLSRSDAASAAARLLSELVQEGAKAAAAETALTLQLRSSPVAARRGVLVSYLAKTAGEVLRLDNPLDPSRSLFELGLDSILALELTGQISEACGRPFRGTVLFTHPTVESLAGHVLDELSLPVEAGTRPEEEELAELIAQEIEGR